MDNREVDLSFLEEIIDKIKTGKIHLVSVSFNRDVKKVGEEDGYIQYKASEFGTVKLKLQFRPLDESRYGHP